MTAVLSVFGRELSLAWAGGSGAFLALGFFIGATLLAPLAIGADADALSGIGPGLIWVTLTLSSLITLERIFQSDLEDGALDLLILGDLPLEVTALFKVLAHWIVTGLPLVAIYPVLAIMLQVPTTMFAASLPAIALGSLGLFLWGGVAAALAPGVRRGGPLIALMVLPLYVPIVIFGALAGTSEQAGGVPPELLFLSAIVLAALAIAPFAMAFALRNAVD